MIVRRSKVSQRLLSFVMIGARAALRSLRNSLVDRSRSLKTFADTHPVVTNALVYGGLYTLAEVSQQNIRQVYYQFLVASTHIILDFHKTYI